MQLNPPPETTLREIGEGAYMLGLEIDVKIVPWHCRIGRYRLKFVPHNTEDFALPGYRPVGFLFPRLRVNRWAGPIGVQYERIEQ